MKKKNQQENLTAKKLPIHTYTERRRQIHAVLYEPRASAANWVSWTTHKIANKKWNDNNNNNNIVIEEMWKYKWFGLI